LGAKVVVYVARRCDMKPAAVSYAVKQGGKTAKQKGYQMEK
jgi:hypothetical protein